MMIYWCYYNRWWHFDNTNRWWYFDATNWWWCFGQGHVQGKFQGQCQGKIQGNCRCCQVEGFNQTDQCKEDNSLIYADQPQLAYIRHTTTSHWSVRFKPSRWQHLRVLGPLAKELSKESSKEITTTDSLEPSLDNSLAKVPRMLRCCHLDGLNQTDQHKVDASLIYADRHWPALTSIYKTCNYFTLVS